MQPYLGWDLQEHYLTVIFLIWVQDEYPDQFLASDQLHQSRSGHRWLHQTCHIVGRVVCETKELDSHISDIVQARMLRYMHHLQQVRMHHLRHARPYYVNLTHYTHPGRALHLGYLVNGSRFTYPENLL